MSNTDPTNFFVNTGKYNDNTMIIHLNVFRSTSNKKTDHQRVSSIKQDVKLTTDPVLVQNIIHHLKLKNNVICQLILYSLNCPVWS